MVNPFTPAEPGGARARTACPRPRSRPASGAPPSEITETVAPLVFWRKEYLADSGGPGRYRGGLGQVMEVAHARRRAVSGLQDVRPDKEPGSRPRRGRTGGLEAASTSWARTAANCGRRARKWCLADTESSWKRPAAAGWATPGAGTRKWSNGTCETAMCRRKRPARGLRNGQRRGQGSYMTRDSKSSLIWSYTLTGASGCSVRSSRRTWRRRPVLPCWRTRPVEWYTVISPSQAPSRRVASNCSAPSVYHGEDPEHPPRVRRERLRVHVEAVPNDQLVQVSPAASKQPSSSETDRSATSSEPRRPS